MTLLIDGDNLIHAAGIVSRRPGPGSLERARRALLNFLVASLTPDELAGTVVVFDSEAAPPGRPRQVEYEGLSVRYASEYEDADALLEELIRADSAPRRLTVVSSDHRVQRAARRRRSQAVDSDVWYARTVRARDVRRGRQTSAASPDRDKPQDLSPAEVERWLREFAPLIAEELLETGSPEQLPDRDAGASATGSSEPVPPDETPGSGDTDSTGAAAHDATTAAPTMGPRPARASRTPDARDGQSRDKARRKSHPKSRRTAQGRPSGKPRSKPDDEKRGVRRLDRQGSPFPPGYGEDLNEENVDEP